MILSVQSELFQFFCFERCVFVCCLDHWIDFCVHCGKSAEFCPVKRMLLELMFDDV